MDYSYYDVPLDFRTSRKLSPYHCPKCGRRGIWRSGVHFEHMMRCPDHGVWTPNEVINYQQDVFK